MAAFFGFGGVPVDVEITLQGEEGRKQIEQKTDKDKKELCPVYYDAESVSGQVSYLDLVKVETSNS
jgi:vacuolar protein sorting-associated protein 26